MPRPSFSFLLAPGAGAPSSHPRMQDFARLLSPLGPVETLDYPYMRENRRRPDPLPRLIEAHRAALAELRRKHGGPVALIGKSMGGRVGCHVALAEPVEAIVCLGYPLCGAGDRTKLRDKVLTELRTPILFVQGTRDPLCPLDLLDNVRTRMTAPSMLHVVEGGDHSLRASKTVLKARHSTQEQVDDAVGEAIADFLRTSPPDPAQRKSTRVAPLRAPSGMSNSLKIPPEFVTRRRAASGRSRNEKM